MWSHNVARRQSASDTLVLLLCGLALALLAGCSSGAEQPKIEPLEPSDVFKNYQSARPLPAHVVARTDAPGAASFTTGQVDDGLLMTLPITVSDELLARGAERYTIYCAPCHGATGAGDGSVVAHGYPTPPSLTSTAVQEAPPGYIFQVITEGRGRMFGYAARVEPVDRWAIVAYIFALQGDRASEGGTTTDDAGNAD